MEAEAAQLRKTNQELQAQLYHLQQQHGALVVMVTQPRPEVQRPEVSLHRQPREAEAVVVGQTISGPPPRHNPLWTEETSSKDGSKYYFNSRSGESTFTRPSDYNPSMARLAVVNGNLRRKGPPGANLFVVRKMRRGEFDEFHDGDLSREFGKYGTVTRAEMQYDKDSGWSRGFAFVSFTTPEEADAAIKGVNDTWIDGKLMKVEKSGTVEERTMSHYSAAYAAGKLGDQDHPQHQGDQ